MFVSDGASNAGGRRDSLPRSQRFRRPEHVVNSIAIAGATCASGTAGTLAEVAVNGGQCFAVPDPNNLPDLIPNLIGSTLTKVEMTVDGGAPTVLTTVPATPVAGPAMVTYSTMTAGLSPGSHVICVTAFGTDCHGWERERADVRDRRGVRSRAHAGDGDERARAPTTRTRSRRHSTGLPVQWAAIR